MSGIALTDIFPLRGYHRRGKRAKQWKIMYIIRISILKVYVKMKKNHMKNEVLEIGRN